MYPNNQSGAPQQQDFSIDYLNQISTPPPKRGKISTLMYVLAGAVLFLVLIVVLGLIFSGGSTSTPAKTNELYMRLTVLRDETKDQHKYLRNNQLRSQNSSLTLFLTNSITDLSSAMAASGVDASKLDNDKAYKAEAAALKTELDDKFEEARLNVRLDRAYTIEMSYQLNVVASLITAIQGRNTSETMQTFIANNAENLATIAEEFNDFNAT